MQVDSKQQTCGFADPREYQRGSFAAGVTKALLSSADMVDQVHVALLSKTKSFAYRATSWQSSLCAAIEFRPVEFCSLFHSLIVSMICSLVSARCGRHLRASAEQRVRGGQIEGLATQILHECAVIREDGRRVTAINDAPPLRAARSGRHTSAQFRRVTSTTSTTFGSGALCSRQ